MARPSKTGSKRSASKTRKASHERARKRIGSKRHSSAASARAEQTDELKEARQQQTATAEILKVIASSPSDAVPVFEAIAISANRLIGGFSTAVYRVIDDVVHLVAFTPTDPEADEALKTIFPLHRSQVPSLTRVQNGQTAQIADAEKADAQSRRIAHARGWRSVTFTPLMNHDAFIGFIACTRREVGILRDHHVQLLRTFADQAVIAIENARLFNELSQRTADLNESLQFQTASSEVLKVISRSPDALQPVLDVIVKTSRELCGSDGATMFLLHDEKFHVTAVSGPIPRHLETLRANPQSVYQPDSLLAHVARLKRTVHIPNVTEDPEFSGGLVGLGGPRALLAVPLLREGEVVGTIVLRQSHDKPFTPRQIQAVETFADQAVIAISNVSLFGEVQARTRDLTESLQQQTATSEVLEIISASAGELEPVFQKMLENAIRVCGAEFGSMNLTENGALRPAAQYNVPAEYAAARGSRVFTPHPTSPLATAIRTKQVVHWPDLRTTESYLERYRAAVELVELGGARTVAIVPMLRDDEVIGAITIFRKEVRLFSDKQIELLSNFAKQAVIAIENARLLKELRQRTEDLSKSLDDLRTAQDRLVQTEKLASLGQLTAGIAHEIKNPLNFVNNFAALSAELTEELDEVLKPAGIGDKMRAEVNELTGLLKSNLEKVVQHGKRADSIVKNMLLHSREGSSEQRAADINALVDESLNLAYHGARAENSGFNIILQRDFDPNAGMVELFPQEISRALLNLLSNGFYAAARRKADNGGAGAEPNVLATTKNLGSSVEIRIRDNGAGIPPEIKEKMFNPFFTTKPTGEGTGLGLSMTHDIVVKQHGGRIDVETRLGEFTEFVIILPRNSPAVPGPKLE